MMMETCWTIVVVLIGCVGSFEAGWVTRDICRRDRPSVTEERKALRDIQRQLLGLAERIQRFRGGEW